MSCTRRDFVKGLSLAVMTPAFAQFPKRRLPIAFSTLGCPRWEWRKILEFARMHGFSAIELRGLEGSMDLPAHPAFAKERIEQTKTDIRAHGLRIACVSSSAHMFVAESGARAKELADARRFIDLAAALGAPCVRVFGGKADSDKDRMPSAESKARVAAGLHELGEYAGPRNVMVVIESHDQYTASPALADVLRGAASENVGLLWDAHHTFATSNEEPELTVRQLGRWMRHTHLKDSLGTGEDRKYVLTGRGNVPIKRQIDALRSSGYKGFYCFEWEKYWHPDLEDPEIAIADFAHVVGDCLGDVRSCST